jgi:hypothetical protein
MKDWQRAWRAFSERFSTEALQSLANALAADSPQIIQGQTVEPRPQQCEGPEPPEGACPWHTADNAVLDDNEADLPTIVRLDDGAARVDLDFSEPDLERRLAELGRE